MIMKKTICMLFLFTLATGAANAQSWLGSAWSYRKDNPKQLQEMLAAKALQAREKAYLEEGELRAFNVNSSAVASLKLEAGSYIPVNYNKENAANCHALLLDAQGTVILNHQCREALHHTKTQLIVTADFSNLLGKPAVYQLKFSREGFIYKDNYAIAQIPLPAPVAEKMTALKTPTLVRRDERWFSESKAFVVKKPLSSLFDKALSQEQSKAFAKRLPGFFFANAHGFAKQPITGK